MLVVHKTMSVPSLTLSLILKRIYKHRIEMSGKTLRWPSDARRMPMTRE